MNYEIKLYQRPSGEVKKQISEVVGILSEKWFTENVAEDTMRDLLFQDAICLFENSRLVSLLIFTCWDGSMHITLIGTHTEYHRKGYGTKLIKYFFDYVKTIGFNRVVVLTVPPEVNSFYENTVDFYLKCGFVINKRYTEIWKNGAIELIKEIE